MRRWLHPRLAARASLALVAALAALAAGAEEPPRSEGPATPDDSPLTMRDVMSSAMYMDLRTAKLAVGDPAFDFALPSLDTRRGDDRLTGRTIRLGSFRGKKPVALVFGSYT
jgi:hypothetical protein